MAIYNMDGIYKHYEGTDAECSGVQYIRELTFATDIGTSGSLRYVDCNSGVHYIGNASSTGSGGLWEATSTDSNYINPMNTKKIFIGNTEPDTYSSYVHINISGNQSIVASSGLYVSGSYNNEVDGFYTLVSTDRYERTSPSSAYLYRSPLTHYWVMDDRGTVDDTTVFYWDAWYIWGGVHPYSADWQGLAGYDNVTARLNASSWPDVSISTGSSIITDSELALKVNNRTELDTLVINEIVSTPSAILGESGVIIQKPIYLESDIYINNIKSGPTQVSAGALANELWKTSSHATLPDNVIMIGV